MSLHPLQIEIRKKANTKKAEGARRYFKTGPGEYAEGDQFVGISVPDLRKISQKFVADFDLKDFSKLMQSPIHEERAAALFVLVHIFEKSKSQLEQKKLVDLYLKNRDGINNWDLVDLSAYKILGNFYQQTQDTQMILKLSKSKRHWDRRIAIVSSFAFIRKNQLDLLYTLAEAFLNQQEDLMHKATGWMLREAGKRDSKRLLSFIHKHGKNMPRTMLRYSIEKFDAKTRKSILVNTKS